MPRQARVVAVGFPHHITQRGSARQQIFFSDRDRRTYLELIRRYAERYKLQLWGYCLMPNHVHLIAVPEGPESMARVFGRAHADYARYRNVIRQACGHFWEARYYSCAMDGVYQWRALAYVERNPVRAGIARTAEEYEWSSAALHCGKSAGSPLIRLEAWRAEYTTDRWREVLSTSVSEESLAERLREATRRGLPLGGMRFVRELEEQTCRCLDMRPPGRPCGTPAPSTTVASSMTLFSETPSGTASQ